MSDKSDLSYSLSCLSALGQDTRLRIFRTLMAASPDGVQAGVLSEQLGVAPNALSAHLSVLTQCGLITATKTGRNMIYRADLSEVSQFLSSLVDTCCHGHPEVCQPIVERSQLSGC